jgi:hypothetical protein
MDEVGRAVMNGLYYVLPNLERFNLKGHVIHHLQLTSADLALIVLYGLAYATFLLVVAGLIFERRDFR